MQTLTATNLTKTYGEKTLFKDISFLIREGDRIGLVGINGTGKTTLLNALTGTDSYDSGQIETPNQYAMSYLAQKPVFDTNLSIMAAIFAGQNPVFKTIQNYERVLAAYTADPTNPKLQTQYEQADAQMTQQDAWTVDTDIKTILTQLHLTDLDQPINTLSGGQQKRVGLAQALIEIPDLLILDEPTNHLDFDSIEWLEKRLAQYKGALLIVTHDRYFLDRVANQIFELDAGQLYTYTGNYEQFLTQKADRIEREQQAAHKQQQLYKQELTWMRAGAKARTTKQQARINRFNDLKGNLTTGPDTSEVDIQMGQSRLGKKVLELKDANLTLDAHPILKDFSLLVQANDRIGITGVNGAGKSSLLNVLAERIPLDSGELVVGETVNLGYYTQQNEDLDLDKRVIAYLQEAGEEVVGKNGDRISVTQLLEQFLFDRSTHGTLIEKLSGGEKRRLYLLKLLMQQPNVLLLDEPTNDLDIGTLTILENYLENFNGTVITVSHDRYFLDQVADKLLVLDGHGNITTEVGLFSDYLAKQKTATTKVTAPKPTPEVTVEAVKEPAAKHKLTYNEQKEYAHIETDLEKLDEQIETIKTEMNQNGADYGKLAEWQAELDRLNQELDEKMARWDYLSEYAD